MSLKPKQFFRRLERQLDEAVEAALKEEAQGTVGRIRLALPANRTRTRRAVRQYVESTAKGYRVRVGLVFSQRYRSRNTQTEVSFRRAWKRVRSRFVSGVNRKLKRKIEEI